MRITVFITSLGGGGAERVATTAMRHWVACGHDVTLVTLAPTDCDLNEAPDGVHRYALDLIDDSQTPWAGFRNNIARLRATRRAFRAARPDVIVSWIDTTNVLALIAAHRLGTPVVVTEVVDPTQHELPRSWRVLRHVTYRWSRALVVISEGLRSWGARLVGADRVHVISNPVAVRPPPPPPPRSGRKRIITMGRLVPQKGIDLLLEAFAQCADSYPDWELAIYGEGPERDALGALAQQLGIGERVMFLGFEPDSPSAFAQADVFALSSRFEGLPVALLEAMTCGLPAIATDTSGGGPASAITHGVDGYLVPLNDAQALASSLARLLGDPDERRRLGANARRIVDRFGPAPIMAKWDALVDRVAS